FSRSITIVTISRQGLPIRGLAPAAVVLRNTRPSDQEQSRRNVSNRRSLRGRRCSSVRGQQPNRLARGGRHRSLQLELLEGRPLLTAYTYPYGAMPDDTGEYMLGDVAVNVVLMESDPTLAPYDNNSPTDPVHPGRGSPVENWDAASIVAVKANVATGLQWW